MGFIIDWNTRVHRDMSQDGILPAPFFHVTLRAGEGLVMPSHSFHRVWSRSSKRIAVNAFFEPKYKKMQWPHTVSHGFKMYEQSTLAMRILWLRALRRLWDTKQLGMFM